MANEEEKDSSSGQRKRLTDEEMAVATNLYELGKAGIAELAEDFGVTRQTLSKRFKDNNVIRGSRSHELTTATEVVQKAVVERFAEKRAEWTEETRMTGYNLFKQSRMITQKIVADQLRAKKPIGEVDDDLKAMQRFNKIIIDNVNATLAILQADNHVDEADLPILTIEDLTDQDILDHHISTGALDEGATLEDINMEIL